MTRRALNQMIEMWLQEFENITELIVPLHDHSAYFVFITYKILRLYPNIQLEIVYWDKTLAPYVDELFPNKKVFITGFDNAEEMELYIKDSTKIILN